MSLSLGERPANGGLLRISHEFLGSDIGHSRSEIADSLRQIFEKLPFLGDCGWRPGPICTAWPSLQCNSSNAVAAGNPDKSGVPAGMDADLYEYRPPVDLSNGKLRKLAAALGPAYVGRAAIRLHPEQLFEVDRLALGFQFRSALLGRFHQGLLRGWHSPPRRCEPTAFGSITHDGRLVVREDARHRREVADVPFDHAEQRADGRLVGGDRVEIMPTSA